MTKCLKNKIIAISGLKNSGKDVSANIMLYLQNTPKIFHHYWIYKLFPKLNIKRLWTKVSFAETLKAMLALLLKVNINNFNDRTFKEQYCIDFNSFTLYNSSCTDKILPDNKFSKLAKDLSINIKDNYLTIRQLMQYFGTEIMRKYFGDQLWCLSTLRSAEHSNIIVSDLRFKVEAEEVKKQHGILIYIDRPGTVVGNHASEREVFELRENGYFDYIVQNNGDLKDLFNKLKEII